MKNIIASALILSSFPAANVVAERNCATEQCERAQTISNLPAEVKSFVDQRDGCDHFRGEPWDGGDDPDVKERREFIFQNIKELCTGADRRLRELRKKYRNDKVITELLKGYEDRIEYR